MQTAFIVKNIATAIVIVQVFHTAVSLSKHANLKDFPGQCYYLYQSRMIACSIRNRTCTFALLISNNVIPYSLFYIVFHLLIILTFFFNDRHVYIPLQQHLDVENSSGATLLCFSSLCDQDFFF